MRDNTTGKQTRKFFFEIVSTNIQNIMFYPHPCKSWGGGGGGGWIWRCVILIWKY